LGQQAGPEREAEPARPRLLQHAHGPRIVGVDHRHVRRLLAPEDARLGRGVALHAVVAVQVVRGEIQHRRRMDAHRVHALELEAGQLEHVGAPGRLEHGPRQRSPEIPADERLEPTGLAQRAQQRGGGALAVGAGDAEDRCARREEAGGELDLAPHRHARLARPDDGGKSQRDARAHHQEVGPAEVELAERRARAHRHPAVDQAPGAERGGRALVQERHPGAVREEQLGRGEPALPRAQHRHRPSLEIHVSAA
jgi:hypothetical protein